MSAAPRQDKTKLFVVCPCLAEAEEQRFVVVSVGPQGDQGLPLLWHILRRHADAGLTDFSFCAYKPEVAVMLSLVHMSHTGIEKH